MLSVNIRGLPLVAAILLGIGGCAKWGYLWEQGRGQIALRMAGKENQQLLTDSKISAQHRQKIQQIQRYKNFFYRYFERERSDIYTQTVLLKSDAVSHLVVASKYYQLKAVEHCFWPMGCFPYLAFFKEQSAIELQKEFEVQGHYTFKRPVYAYSTLGYFQDHILSSFFRYGEFKLAELIFHELFHTIFFIVDEVDLNENLANYFGQQLAMEFFSDRPQWVQQQREKWQKYKSLKQKVVEQAQWYERSLKAHPPSSRAAADKRLAAFLSQRLRPTLVKACQKAQVSPCREAKRPWNNASLSAYLTYEDKMRPIEQLHRFLGLSLRQYFHYIERQYQNYKGKDFAAYLLNRSP